MSDYAYNKVDFIILIVLALLVAFIIGFNIIQVVDSKLSSVTINVPPQKYELPPIYLSLDKDGNQIKQIKLNDVITLDSNQSIINNEENEYFTNLNTPEPYNNDSIENYGNIEDYPLLYDDNRRHLISSVINSDDQNNIIDQKTKYETAKDPNYNTVNNIPLLFAPDTDVPNRAGPDSKGYYESKVKLIDNPNSPLMKLAKSYSNKIDNIVAKSTLEDRTKVPEINGTFDGYNAFVDLRTDSYANITSIGKSMLSPYVSYPIPS